MGLRVKYSQGYVIKVPSARASGTLQKQISVLLKQSTEFSMVLSPTVFPENIQGKAKRMVILYLSSYLIKKRGNSTSKREVIPCSAQDFSVQSYFQNGQ